MHSGLLSKAIGMWLHDKQFQSLPIVAFRGIFHVSVQALVLSVTPVYGDTPTISLQLYDWNSGYARPPITTRCKKFWTFASGWLTLQNAWDKIVDSICSIVIAKAASVTFALKLCHWSQNWKKRTHKKSFPVNNQRGGIPWSQQINEQTNQKRSRLFIKAVLSWYRKRDFTLTPEYSHTTLPLKKLASLWGHEHTVLPLLKCTTVNQAERKLPVKVAV